VVHVRICVQSIYASDVAYLIHQLTCDALEALHDDRGGTLTLLSNKMVPGNTCRLQRLIIQGFGADYSLDRSRSDVG